MLLQSLLYQGLKQLVYYLEDRRRRLLKVARWSYRSETQLRLFVKTVKAPKDLVALQCEEKPRVVTATFRTYVLKFFFFCVCDLIVGESL